MGMSEQSSRADLVHHGCLPSRVSDYFRKEIKYISYEGFLPQIHMCQKFWLRMMHIYAIIYMLSSMHIYASSAIALLNPLARLNIGKTSETPKCSTSFEVLKFYFSTFFWLCVHYRLWHRHIVWSRIMLYTYMQFTIFNNPVSVILYYNYRIFHKTIDCFKFGNSHLYTGCSINLHTKIKSYSWRTV